MIRLCNSLNKWLLAIWLILMGGTLSSGSAYSQVQPPSAWRSTPVMSNDCYPQYRFQSTSTLAPVVGQRSYTATQTYNPVQSSAPRRSSPWDEDPGDNDNQLGIVEDKLPVGNPLVLLFMAFLYFFYKKMSKKSKKMQKNLVMSKKSSTFAPAFDGKGVNRKSSNRQ